MTYEIGDLVRLTVLFTDINNVPENPTNTTLLIMYPDGTEPTPPSVINPATGTFYADLSVAQSGIYRYRWTGVGSVQAVQEGQILVSATILVPVSPIDLTTLGMVKSYLNVCDAGSDSVISSTITAASVYWLWATGQGNADGSVPSVSPYVQPVPYSEYYDGNGNDRLFLRHSPIVSVQALYVNGTLIQQAAGFGTSGFSIDQNGKCLVYRSGSGGGRRATAMYLYGAIGGGCFPNGTQNINVQYTAGFQATPPDIVEAVTEMVGLTIKRRGWIDQKQNAQPDTLGTVTYRDWEFTPSILSVMKNYARRAAI